MANLGKNALTGDRAAMEVLKSADLVVDNMLLLFSREQIEIQQAAPGVPVDAVERIGTMPHKSRCQARGVAI